MPEQKEIPLPPTRYAAWQLGRLAGLVERCDQEEGQKMAVEAATILGVHSDLIDSWQGSPLLPCTKACA